MIKKRTLYHCACDEYVRLVVGLGKSRGFCVRQDLTQAHKTLRSHCFFAGMSKKKLLLQDATI